VGRALDCLISGVDVLQADLTASHELRVAGSADFDLPELLGPSLQDRFREDVKASLAMRAQEVGVVRDTDGAPPFVLDRLTASKAPVVANVSMAVV
jgi:hypothetical protein